MGQILLACRLAGRDLRHRPAQPLLLVLVLTAAMATLTLGLALHGVTRAPFGQTRAATAGPDVVASSTGFSGAAESGAAARGRLAALARVPGVTAHSGPYPVAWPVLRAHGTTADVMAEGRDPGRAAVDQPEVIQGSWLRGSGGVVLERAFADALGVRVGDRVTLGGLLFRVTGIAVTAAVPVYTQVCFFSGCAGPPGRSRSFDTGLVWVSRAAARGLASPGNPLTYYLNLRLARPAAAAAFARAHQPPPGDAGPPLTAWPALRTAAATIVTQEQRVLGPASWLLALLAVASVAVVAGARMAEQRRRVGLLKAAGGTPGLAAAVLMAEHLVVALAGAAAGLVVGRLVAPLLTSPGASLVGSPGAPALTPGTVLVVAAAAVAVASAATLVPALRAARVTTMAALAEETRPPRRRAALVRLSAGLPVPLLLGARLVTRRPGGRCSARPASRSPAPPSWPCWSTTPRSAWTPGTAGRGPGRPTPARPGSARSCWSSPSPWPCSPRPTRSSRRGRRCWTRGASRPRCGRWGPRRGRRSPGCPPRSCCPRWSACCSASRRAASCTAWSRTPGRTAARRPGGCW